MTANKSQRPSANRKGLAAQALFVGALLLIARFLWVRDRPERLMHVPLWRYTVSDSRLYLVTSGSPFTEAPPTFQVQPIDGRPMQVISSDEARYQVYNFQTAPAFSIADGNLYYALELRSKGASLAGHADVPNGVAPFLGTFLLQPPDRVSAEITREKRTAFQDPLPAKERRLRQVALKDRKTRDVATLRGESFCLVGSHVFWIQPAPEETDLVKQGRGLQNQGRWFETSARSDLMLTALADGVTRCIRHGIPRGTLLVAGKSGASWKEPRLFPGRPTLCYARIADESVRTLGTLSDSSLPPLCVEFGNRLYWTDAVDPQRKSDHNVLMSADLGGKDVREVCTQANNHEIETLLLYVYQGDLYGCLTQSPAPTEDPSKRKQFLCRLYPDRPDPIEVLYKLPGVTNAYQFASNFQFDGGYLYFALNEQKQGLWTALMGDNVGPDGPEATGTLCRIPLKR